MADQKNIIPPELLRHVLEHVNIHEQFILRRVDQDFKQVIENDVWSLYKKLNLKRMSLNRKILIPKEACEVMLSHMPGLRHVVVNERIEGLVSLLSRYCLKLKTVEADRSFAAIEYINQLSSQGIYETPMILMINWLKFEHLDQIDPRSSYKIETYIWDDEPEYIPDRYRDRIHRIFMLEEGWDSTYLDELLQNYSSKFAELEVVNHVNVDKLFQFKNLNKLTIDLDFIDLDYPESGVVETLERYLKSDSSCHLDSLKVYLYYEINAVRLVKTLSSLDRPKKWKLLRVHYSYAMYPIIDYEYQQLSLMSVWKDEPIMFLTDLLKRIQTPEVLELLYFDDKMKISREKFDVLKSELVSYAANHRNKQITIKILPRNYQSEDVLEIKDEQNENWSISYLSILLSNS